MAINKVTLDGNDLIDLTQDTVTEDAVGEGITFHDASGAAKTGTLAAVQYTPQTLTSEQQEQARTNIGAADLHSVGTLQGIVDDLTTGVTSVPSAVKATQDGDGNNIVDTYALLHNENGGFNAGSGATSTDGGGAVGSSANAQGGGAVGNNAISQSGGGAVGKSAKATGGGGAVGSNTTAMNGSGAVGYYATAVNQGFAGGYQAICEGTGAVQLGTGSNTNANTLQFRSYPLVDANGHIPAARLDGDYDISVSYATQANSAGTATTAATATQATRAIGDGDGNNIINFYAKKTEIPALKYQHNVHMANSNNSIVVIISGLLFSRSTGFNNTATFFANLMSNYDTATIECGGNYNGNAILQCWAVSSYVLGVSYLNSNGVEQTAQIQSGTLSNFVRDQVIPMKV